MIEKSKRKPKFEVRRHNRCLRCGRARAYLKINGQWRDHLLFGLLHEDFRG